MYIELIHDIKADLLLKATYEVENLIVVNFFPKLKKIIYSNKMIFVELKYKKYFSVACF